MKKTLLYFALVGFLLALACDALLLSGVAYQFPFILNPYAFGHMALYGADTLTLVVGNAIIYLLNISFFVVLGFLFYSFRNSRLKVIPILLVAGYYAYWCNLFLL